jgi:hypothetical protein
VWVVSGIAGLALIGTGALIFFEAPSGSTGATTVGVSPAAQGAALSVGGRF